MFKEKRGVEKMKLEKLNKYREECVRISNSVINGNKEVLRMNGKPFKDGNKGKCFDSVKDAKEWIKKNGFKVWGYWELEEKESDGKLKEVNN